jgi:ATP-binding cassette subfamily B protein
VTLEDVTLTIPSGRITVVSGETGCGKSTLLALLQRFYAPEIGRIVVGEHDLSYFSLASWRAGLGVVSQQTHLLSGTLLQNVAPGDYKPDLERIVRLCREVGALEFIERMPQGFATPLIEGGANLSGGQRQRLALVRAFYSDTPILLLDEPTSALDTAAEQNLLVQLARLRNAGKTIVIASHAPAVFAIADHIVRLRAGRVVKAPEIKPARDAPLSI